MSYERSEVLQALAVELNRQSLCAQYMEAGVFPPAVLVMHGTCQHCRLHIALVDSTLWVETDHICNWYVSLLEPDFLESLLAVIYARLSYCPSLVF